MLSWIFFLLSLRSYFLCWYEEKPSVWRAWDGVAGTLSLGLFFLLPTNFAWKPFAVSTLIIAFSLYRRLSNPTRGRQLSLQRVIGTLSFYIFGTFVALLANFFQLSEGQKVGKVILTGKSKNSWVTWKNPQNLHAESACLQSYEVVVEDSKGNEVSRQFIYGDLVGVRAEVMTIRWPMQLLGLSHLCHLETLYNSYTTARRHNLLPHAAYTVSFPFQVLQPLWKKIYQHEWAIPGVKNATLESTYIPLVTDDLKPSQRSYWLIVGSSGLSSSVISSSSESVH